MIKDQINIGYCYDSPYAATYVACDLDENDAHDGKRTCLVSGDWSEELSNWVKIGGKTLWLTSAKGMLTRRNKKMHAD